MKAALIILQVVWVTNDRMHWWLIPVPGQHCFSLNRWCGRAFLLLPCDAYAAAAAYAGREFTLPSADRFLCHMHPLTLPLLVPDVS